MQKFQISKLITKLCNFESVYASTQIFVNKMCSEKQMPNIVQTHNYKCLFMSSSYSYQHNAANRTRYEPKQRTPFVRGV